MSMGTIYSEYIGVYRYETDKLLEKLTKGKTKEEEAEIYNGFEEATNAECYEAFKAGFHAAMQLSR